MKIVRFLKEFFNVSLKCERLGHKTGERKVRVRKTSYEHREVVADYDAVQHVCRRWGCVVVVDTVIGGKIEGYTGCSMPQAMWDDIRKNGFVIIDDY